MSSELERELLSCSDEEKCQKAASELIHSLSVDQSARRAFSEAVAMPFADEDRVELLERILSHSDCCDSWLIYLSANVVLHSLCNIGCKRSILRQVFRRLESVPDELIEFMLSEAKDEAVRNTLNDQLLLHLSQCAPERQLRLLRLVLQSPLRVLDSRESFLSSIVETAISNEAVYTATLSQSDLPLEWKVMLHLALFNVHRDQYLMSFERIMELSKGSETARWYANHYATLYY